MSKTTNTSQADASAQVSLLQTFTDLGMFASKEVKQDEIELPGGKKAEFYVRELPDAEFRKLWTDGDRAKLIAATVCDCDGNAVMNSEQAAGLKPLIAAKLQELVMKHSGFGEKAAAEQEAAGNG